MCRAPAVLSEEFTNIADDQDDGGFAVPTVLILGGSAAYVQALAGAIRQRKLEAVVLAIAAARVLPEEGLDSGNVAVAAARQWGTRAVRAMDEVAVLPPHVG